MKAHGFIVFIGIGIPSALWNMDGSLWDPDAASYSASRTLAGESFENGDEVVYFLKTFGDRKELWRIPHILISGNKNSGKSCVVGWLRDILRVPLYHIDCQKEIKAVHDAVAPQHEMLRQKTLFYLLLSRIAHYNNHAKPVNIVWLDNVSALFPALSQLYPRMGCLLGAITDFLKERYSIHGKLSICLTEVLNADYRTIRREKARLPSPCQNPFESGIMSIRVGSYSLEDKLCIFLDTILTSKVFSCSDLEGFFIRDETMKGAVHQALQHIHRPDHIQYFASRCMTYALLYHNDQLTFQACAQGCYDTLEQISCSLQKDRIHVIKKELSPFKRPGSLPKKKPTTLKTLVSPHGNCPTLERK